MSGGWSLREAEPADAEPITALINLAFRVEQFFVKGDRITADEVRRRFTTGKFILAEDGAKLVGCVWVQQRGKRAYVGLLSVDPARQGGGIGSRLMVAAEDHARRIGCRIVELAIVNLRAELPAFYRQRGYVETGTEPFSDPARVKMDCHFVNMEKSLET